MDNDGSGSGSSGPHMSPFSHSPYVELGGKAIHFDVHVQVGVHGSGYVYVYVDVVPYINGVYVCIVACTKACDVFICLYVSSCSVGLIVFWHYVIMRMSVRAS